MLQQQNERLLETIKLLKAATTKNTSTKPRAGAGGGDNSDDSDSSDSYVSSSDDDSSNDGAGSGDPDDDPSLDSPSESGEDSDSDGNENIDDGSNSKGTKTVLVSLLKQMNRHLRKSMEFEQKKYENKLRKESAVGSLPLLTRMFFLVALRPPHRSTQSNLSIKTKKLKFCEAFKVMVKDKSVEKIFAQINTVVAGREFSVKKTLFAEFVKSEGVLPPTGSSFGGLTVFAFSPITYIHTAAERKRRLKTAVYGIEED